MSFISRFDFLISYCINRRFYGTIKRGGVDDWESFLDDLEDFCPLQEHTKGRRKYLHPSPFLNLIQFSPITCSLRIPARILALILSLVGFVGTGDT